MRLSRTLIVALLAAALLFAPGRALDAVAPGQAGASAPQGPRLAMSVFDGERSEVITTDPSGQNLRRPFAAVGASVGDRLSWSAAGDLLSITVPGAEGPVVVGVAPADGSSPRIFPRAFLHGGQVMAPDGASVVFPRSRLVEIPPGTESYLFKGAIWSLDVADGSVRRLTRWRLAVWLQPTSFSPDGSTLAAELIDRGGRRAVAIDLRSKRTTPLAREAQEPTYSPDGSRLAFVRERTRLFDLPKPNRPVSELWVASADGSGARRLLRRRGFISWPSWDPSGSRLTFTYDRPDVTGSRGPEFGNEVMAINADGTCLTTVFSDPGLTLYGAAWQPGPGREAGPISC